MKINLNYLLLILILILFICPVVFGEDADLRAGQEKIRQEIQKGIAEFGKQSQEIGENLLGGLDAILREYLYKFGIAMFCSVLFAITLFFLIRHKLEKWKRDMIIELAPSNPKGHHKAQKNTKK